MGTIFNIQRFCIHDGDGIRTTVFLKGCPLRCIWCHNPEGLDRCPSLSFREEQCSACGRCLSVCPARSIQNGKLELDRNKCIACGECATICLNSANEVIGYEASSQEVFAQVMRDKIFYDSSGGGLTVSGGEPSSQAEFTLELLRLAKEAGIGRAIESCGMGSREFYQRAAELGTVFLFDLKCMDAKKHRALTGVDNKHIISHLLYLFEIGADVILRIPLIPGCNDSDDDIRQLCEFLKGYEGRYRYAEIMPYHAMGVGKSKRVGKNIIFAQEDAGTEKINRWLELFRQGGIDQIRISR